MTGRHPLAAPALVIGVFGHVGFFAGFSRDALPTWLRVGAHMALLAPLVFIHPPERAPRPALGVLAAAAAIYLGLTLASFYVLLDDHPVPAAGFFLLLEVPGSIVALAALSRARRLLWPKEPR